MWIRLVSLAGAILLLDFGDVIPLYADPESTPIDFKIAFVADQSLGNPAVDVLRLIADEGADAVLHSGDFDYLDDPTAWEHQIDAVLGESFPYFAGVGNHDEAKYYQPVTGYQDLIESRMTRLGITWSGDLGVRSTLTFQGILFVQTAPGIFDQNDAGQYIDDALAGSDAVWRISSWHKNMQLMQVGTKLDETGWDVYEAARRGAAIIATGHEHSYSRTHLLADFSDQTVANTSSTLTLSADDAASIDQDEGRTFAFVSGLGGHSIRSQSRGGNWWATVYSASQSANFGALFGVFNYHGDPRLAYFYFKDIDGVVADEFYVRSTVGSVSASTTTNPTATSTSITTTTTIPSGSCGDPVDTGLIPITASDALFILRTAAFLESCRDCICDVDNSGAIVATDALAVLQMSTGVAHPLDCPSCG